MFDLPLWFLFLTRSFIVQTFLCRSLTFYLIPYSHFSFLFLICKNRFHLLSLSLSLSLSHFNLFLFILPIHFFFFCHSVPVFPSPLYVFLSLFYLFIMKSFFSQETKPFYYITTIQHRTIYEGVKF